MPDASSPERVKALRDAMLSGREEVESAIADANRAYDAARLLVDCNPTSQWEGIVSRLAGAVLLFRTENALARKLDPLDIKAFRKSPALDLRAPEERPLRESVSESLEDAHSRLRALRKAAIDLGLPGRTDDRRSELGLEEVVS